MVKTVSPEDQRRRLDFATELRIFAKTHAPDSRTESLVHKVANQIQREFGESLRLKMDRVVAYMRSDAAGESVSQPELIEHFRWRRQTMNEVIAALLNESPQRIEHEKRQTVNPGPRGGRPATRYRLIRR